MRPTDPSPGRLFHPECLDRVDSRSPACGYEGDQGHDAGERAEAPPPELNPLLHLPPALVCHSASSHRLVTRAMFFGRLNASIDPRDPEAGMAL